MAEYIRSIAGESECIGTLSDFRKDDIVHRYQNVAWRISLALLVITGGLIGIVLHQSPVHATPSDCPSCTGTWYGGLSTDMNWAISYVWPQKPGSSYCGVEDAIALDNYDNLVSGQSVAFSSNDDQVTLGNRNQVATLAPDMVGPPAGMSQWGWG